MSVSSEAPPISQYNRSFGQHRRNDSPVSASSVAMAYAWICHERHLCSTPRLTKTWRQDVRQRRRSCPLTSISASLPKSAASQSQSGRRTPLTPSWMRSRDSQWRVLYSKRPDNLSWSQTALSSVMTTRTRINQDFYLRLSSARSLFLALGVCIDQLTMAQ